MKEKNRLDIALVEQGLCESREKAKALIMAGKVFVGGERADKAGYLLRGDEAIEVRGEQLAYVSRGGLKLEKMIHKHHLDLGGFICMDIGASTGGFTDCMLQNGARKVYAIDVGYGQLAWKLRSDDRVVNLERTNFRYVTNEQVPDLCDFASVDVSFISLTLILPVLRELLKLGGRALLLVKPQFEAGKGKVGKKGVVRDPAVHREVLDKILSFCSEHGFCVLDMDYSPIKGPEGNIEYLYYIEKSESITNFSQQDTKRLVEDSHLALDRAAAGDSGLEDTK